MQEVIKVEQLTKSYGALTAVDRLSLSVDRGTVFGLLGANGAGKSTAIECILGTKKADNGSVSILGLNPGADRRKLFERVGVQFQEANYQDKITLWELCQVTTSLYRQPADPAALLDKFGLSGRKRCPVRSCPAASGSACLLCWRSSPTRKSSFWTN